MVPLTMPRTRAIRLPARSRASGPSSGMPAGDGRLEAQRAVGRARRALQLRAVVGEQVLVRRDDRPAVGERRQHQRPGRLVAAHDLDDHVDLGARDEMGGRVGQQRLGDAGGLRPLDVPDGDAGEDQRRAVGGGEAAATARGGTHDLAADGARAEHADAQRLKAHGGFAVTGREWAAVGGDGSDRAGGRPVAVLTPVQRQALPRRSSRERPPSAGGRSGGEMLDTSCEPPDAGLLDTSTLLLMPRLDAERDLPRKPLISAVTLAELAVGPLVTHDVAERASRIAHVQQRRRISSRSRSMSLLHERSGRWLPTCARRDARRRHGRSTR